MSNPSQADVSLPAEAVAELANGNKVEAIKIVREITGLGLKEAKDLVDNYNPDQPPFEQVRTVTGELQLPSEALNELYAGNKIGAIKYTREHNRIGLKDAKDFVEDYIDKNPAIKAEMDAVQAESLRRFLHWLIPAILLIGFCVYYFSGN